MARALPAAAPDVGAHVLCRVILPNLRETRMLDLKDEWRTLQTCNAFRFDRYDARLARGKYFNDYHRQNWPRLSWALPRDVNAILDSPNSENARSKCMDLYRADMLLRCFLHHVLRRENQVVLAGSAATAILQNKLYVRRLWRPSDMDFFVLQEQRVRYIIDAYVDGVLKPLGCEVWDQKTVLNAYEESDGDGEWPPLRITERTAEPCAELHDLIPGDSAGGYNVGYDVLQTVRLQAALPRYLLNLILPLNIVLIRVRAGTGDLAARVRGAFDLIPCGVSVTMSDDFSFRCTCAGCAVSAARQGVLYFDTDNVRRRKIGDVPRLLARVEKYLDRGFRFARASSVYWARFGRNDVYHF